MNENDKVGGPLLTGPKSQPTGADEPPSLLQPSQAEPGSPPAGVTIHVTPDHLAAAHRVLSAASDTLGPAIGELLGLAPPAAPARKVTSSPEAQALVAGLLQGLG